MDDSHDDGPEPAGEPPADVSPGPFLPPPDPAVPGGVVAAPSAPAGRPVRARVITGAVAVVLALAGFFGVRALTSHGTTAGATSPGAAGGGPGGGRGGGVAGTIASIDGSTMTIKARNGNTTKVTTSSSTRFTKTSTGTVADVKVGDHVVAPSAPGATGGTDPVTAPRIVDSGSDAAVPGFGGGGARRNGNGTAPDGAPPNSVPPGAGRPGGLGSVVAGVVKSVDGTTVTVTKADGSTATVNTGSTTTVSLLRPSSMKDLAVGQTVRATGKAGSDGTVAARTVTEGQAGFGFGGGLAPGTGGASANQPN